MRARFLITLFGLVCLCLATSCNRSTKKRIGVVPKAVAHVFWQSVHAGAVAAGREADVEIEWKGPPTETDFSRQIEIVDAMINAHVDGIVLAPTSAESLIHVVERAAREGIPTAIFDSGINTEEYVTFVATNNYDAGAMAARELGRIIEGKGMITVIKIVAGSGSTMEREKGFADTIAAEFPEITIVDEQYCNSDRAKALSVAENMLTAHPDLDAIFASAEPATVGAAQAIKSRGLAGKVHLMGFDSGVSIEKSLREGVIDALVVQDPFNIGYEAVRSVVASLRGETPPKRIDSPATVVTLENVDTPEIDKLLHPDLEKYLQ